MGQIFKVLLRGDSVPVYIFPYNGNELPRGSSVLRVEDGSGRSWDFKFESRGDGRFTVSGSEWRNFAGSRIGNTVTLSKTNGHYKIRVR